MGSLHPKPKHGCRSCALTIGLVTGESPIASLIVTDVDGIWRQDVGISNASAASNGSAVVRSGLCNMFWRMEIHGRMEKHGETM